MCDIPVTLVMSTAMAPIRVILQSEYIGKKIISESSHRNHLEPSLKNISPIRGESKCIKLPPKLKELDHRSRVLDIGNIDLDNSSLLEAVSLNDFGKGI